MRHIITISKKLTKIQPNVKIEKYINEKHCKQVINIVPRILEKKGNQKLNPIEIKKLLYLP